MKHSLFFCIFKDNIKKFFAICFVFYLSLFVQNGFAEKHFDETKEYSSITIIDAGQKFFGKTTEGLSDTIEKIFSRYGAPKAYILGEQASGAAILGATYGEGHIYFKNNLEQKIYWQGPSLGWDFGASGTRVMMLVYNIDTIDQIWNQRFTGPSGSFYAVVGLGVNVLFHDKLILIPIQTGIGARVALNINYLKFTPTATWNPF